MSTSSPIPSLYRIFFTILDPIIGASGIVFHRVPAMALGSYASQPVLPPTIETQLLLDTMSTFFACFTFMEIFVLKAAPHNVAIWKAFEFGILLSDFGMTGAFLRALSSEGRLEPSLWRAGEWINIGVTATVGAIRALFLLGVGVPKVSEKKKL